MNNKITKTRLKNYFVYDFIKTVIITVLIVVLLIFTFNLVKVQPKNGQRMVILLGNDIIYGDECDELLRTTCSNGALNYGFSYDIFNAQYSSISSRNPTQDLIIRRDVYDDDILITTKTLADSYYETSAISFDRYLREANAYINKFLDENGQVVDKKVIDNFYKTRSKDNRFKTKEEKQKGIKYELERIKGLKKNIETLEKVFEENPQIFSSEYLDAGYDEGQNIYGYAIELSKLTGKEGKNIKNAFMVKEKLEEGQTEQTYTTEGIYLMLGRNDESDGDLFFEPMAFILNLINTYTNFIEGN